MCFVYSQTLIQLYNQLAGCQAADSQQSPSSIAIHSGHNPCSIRSLGFGVRQMRPLFGGITKQIEKIHATSGAGPKATMSISWHGNAQHRTIVIAGRCMFLEYLK